MMKIEKTFHRFVLIVLCCVFVPLLAAAGANPVNIDSGALDAYITKVMKDFEAVGLAVAIIQDNQVVFEKGYGVRASSGGERVTVQTLFNIASCSKAFTAAAIGLLVEEGKLDWDDKVIDYLPGFKLSDTYITANLTIRDLLCHRSGLETFGGDLLWYETAYSSREIVERMRSIPIKLQFRAEYGYQNCMYIAAGEVIEKVSGKPWAEFVTEKIFVPLAMAHTRPAGMYLEEGMDIARPHVGTAVYPRWIQKPNAAASIFSSVSDLAHWMIMLLDNGKWNNRQVLAGQTIEECFAPQIVRRVPGFMKENGTNFVTYGLGWGIFDYYGERIVEHSGGMPGYISKVTLVPARKLGIVVLSNDMNALSTVLRYKILDMYLGREAGSGQDWAEVYLNLKKKEAQDNRESQIKREKNRVAKTRPSLPLAGYTGLYEDRVYGEAEIQLVNKKLVLTLLPTREIFTGEMKHWHYDTFCVQFKDEFLPPGYVTFSFDSHGKVIGFTIDLPNPDFHFKNLDFKKKN